MYVVISRIALPVPVSTLQTRETRQRAVRQDRINEVRILKVTHVNTKSVIVDNRAVDETITSFAVHKVTETITIDVRTKKRSARLSPCIPRRASSLQKIRLGLFASVP